MSEKKMTVMVTVIAVLLALGHYAAFSFEAEAARAEAAILRAEMQELSEHNKELRDSLVTLSDEYHRLWDETHVEQTAWQDAGEFVITHYCGCAECCGKSDCITATGTLGKMGRTVSVDPDVIPLGSEVLINGVCYIAEDVGVRGKVIDVYIDSHEQALAMGVYKTEVAYR